MPLTGLFAHRLRSGLASIVAGFAFAAAIAAIGFASSLEILSATAFLAGMTSGVMDVAMNANASDVERRWGRPIMSSFHAAFSLGGAAGALLGGWLGERGTALGLFGPALLSSLLVAVAVPFLMREGQRFQRRRICGAQPAPLAARRARFRVDGDGRRGRRLERNLSRPLGRGAGRDRSRLRGLFASDDHRQDCRRRNRRRRGTARDGWLWRSPRRGGARDQRRMAGACRRRHRLRTGWRGPRQCRACPLQRRRADRVIAGGRRRFRRDLGLRGSAHRAGHHWRRRFRLSVCARRSSCWRALRCIAALFASSKAGGLAGER